MSSSVTPSHTSTPTPTSTPTRYSSGTDIQNTTSQSHLTPTTSPSTTSSPTGSSTAAPSNNSSGLSKKALVGVIVGPIIGGLAFLLIITWVILYIRRRRNVSQVPITHRRSSSPFVQQMATQQYEEPQNFNRGLNTTPGFRLEHGE
jgi:predicted lipid-binding transport protein (Tim44 family)